VPLLPPADVAALLAVVALWWGFAWLTEKSRWAGLSLSAAIHRQRLDWMLQLSNREVRISDTALLGNLMRSMSFFASATVVILGGVAAMLGSSDRAYEAVVSITVFAPQGGRDVFEIKVLVLGLIFINSFLKFTWGLRQFNYCCILVGAAPMAGESEEAKKLFARRAARVCELGALSFNQGLRGYYFALATLAWFMHPLAYVGAAILVVLILWRREYHSKTRRAVRGL